MTPFPHSVEANAGLEVAHEMMARNRIRHLPVMEGTHLQPVKAGNGLNFALSCLLLQLDRVAN